MFLVVDQAEDGRRQCDEGVGNGRWVDDAKAQRGVAREEEVVDAVSEFVGETEEWRGVCVESLAGGGELAQVFIYVGCRRACGDLQRESLR